MIYDTISHINARMKHKTTRQHDKAIIATLKAEIQDLVEICDEYRKDKLFFENAWIKAVEENARLKETIKFKPIYEEE